MPHQCRIRGVHGADVHKFPAGYSGNCEPRMIFFSGNAGTKNDEENECELLAHGLDPTGDEEGVGSIFENTAIHLHAADFSRGFFGAKADCSCWLLANLSPKKHRHSRDAMLCATCQAAFKRDSPEVRQLLKCAEGASNIHGSAIVLVTGDVGLVPPSVLGELEVIGSALETLGRGLQVYRLAGREHVVASLPFSMSCYPPEDQRLLQALPGREAGYARRRAIELTSGGYGHPNGAAAWEALGLLVRNLCGQDAP